MLRNLNFIHDTLSLLSASILIEISCVACPTFKNIILENLELRTERIYINIDKLYENDDEFSAELVRRVSIFIWTTTNIVRFIRKGSVKTVQAFIDIRGTLLNISVWTALSCNNSFAQEMLNVIKPYLSLKDHDRYIPLKYQIDMCNGRHRKTAISDYLYSLCLENNYQSLSHIFNKFGYVPMTPNFLDILVVCAYDNIDYFKVLNTDITDDPHIIQRIISNGCIKIYLYVRDRYGIQSTHEHINTNCIEHAIVDGHVEILRVLLQCSTLIPLVMKMVNDDSVFLRLCDSSDRTDMINFILSKKERINYKVIFRG